jgi:hypothetical protein
MIAQDQPNKQRADARGFRYALAPYMKQQEWLMEKVQTELGQAQNHLRELRQSSNSADGALRSQSAHMEAGLQRGIDPRAHSQGLVYLVSLQKTLIELKGRIESAQQRQRALLTERLKLQQKLDGLERHRAQELASYVQEVTRLEAVEADRDWLAREHLRISAQTKPLEMGLGRRE